MEEEPTVITVQQGEQSIEILAEQIEALAYAAEKLSSSGLTERAVVVLLHDLIGPTRMGKRQIIEVLDALPRLREFLTD